MRAGGRGEGNTQAAACRDTWVPGKVQTVRDINKEGRLGSGKAEEGAAAPSCPHIPEQKCQHSRKQCE